MRSDKSSYNGEILPSKPIKKFTLVKDDFNEEIDKVIQNQTKERISELNEKNVIIEEKKIKKFEVKDVEVKDVQEEDSDFLEDDLDVLEESSVLDELDEVGRSALAYLSGERDQKIVTPFKNKDTFEFLLEDDISKGKAEIKEFKRIEKEVIEESISDKKELSENIFQYVPIKRGKVNFKYLNEIKDFSDVELRNCNVWLLTSKNEVTFEEFIVKLKGLNPRISLISNGSTLHKVFEGILDEVYNFSIKKETYVGFGRSISDFKYISIFDWVYNNGGNSYYMLPVISFIEEKKYKVNEILFISVRGLF